MCDENKRECQQGVSSILRGSNAETTGSKGCVDMRDRRQIVVGTWKSIENVQGCGAKERVVEAG